MPGLPFQISKLGSRSRLCALSVVTTVTTLLSVLTLPLISMSAAADDVACVLDDQSEFSQWLASQRAEASMQSCGDQSSAWWSDLSFFGGIDGSKQPQDFGVNANLGFQGSVNAGIPLNEELGLGLQIGTGIVASDNAVRVYELLGVDTHRTQSFTTLGIFQRCDNGFTWAVAHDFLVQDSFDDFFVSQWRLRAAMDADACNQFGVTAQIADRADAGLFGATPVVLRPITQATCYWRHQWESSVQTTGWIGIAEGHGENNAVTGPSAAKDAVPVFGADILAPLNDHLAIYGETNLMMPADTGTVDAFLGIQWFPGGGARKARRTPFSPVLSVAAPTTFSVDLR